MSNVWRRVINFHIGANKNKACIISVLPQLHDNITRNGPYVHYRMFLLTALKISAILEHNVIIFMNVIVNQLR